MPQLTTSYQRISTIALTYGEIRTYAKYSSQSASANTTTYQLKSTYYTWQNTVSFSSATGNLDGTVRGYGSTTMYKGETLISEVSRTISHNADGSTKTKNVATSWTATFGGGGSASANITFPKIQRDFTSTPSISASNITPTSVKISWSTSQACDLVKYKLNSGDWIQAWTGNATSGNFTISGLNSSTNYSIVGDFRRKDTQRTKNSNTISIKTLARPFRIRVNGVWKEAKPYVRVNGAWKEAKPYVRVNNTWKEGI